MTDTAATEPTDPRTIKLIRRSAVLAGLGIVLADWLFYDRPVGTSAAIFIVFLAACGVITHPVHLPRNVRLTSAAILLASILPIIDNAGLLALLSGVVGLSIYTLMVTRAFSGDILDRLKAMARLIISGPCRLLSDVPKLKSGGRLDLSVWAMPVVLGLIFLFLFWSANPLIETWFDELRFFKPGQWLSFKRILFWCLTLVLSWSFLRGPVRPLLNWGRKTTPATDQAKAPASHVHAANDALFGPAAVLRSLILFNVLFAVQTGLDITYLWGGVSLPEGMTYATYAHRGAYPLIFAALLAAAFVLLILKPGSDMERSRLLRTLVYVWIGQTVLLVISSILRLNLYVEVYSLTYTRVAAFVWMFLVAIGLKLIVARIVLRQSNSWLVSTNVAALAATLYACAFINFPYVIADYNVEHSKDVSGKGTALDTRYLCSLGPQALPAMETYVEHLGDGYNVRQLLLNQGCLQSARRHHDRLEDWRAWTYRDWRLSQYLSKHGDFWSL